MPETIKRRKLSKDRHKDVMHIRMTAYEWKVITRAAKAVDLHAKVSSIARTMMMAKAFEMTEDPGLKGYQRHVTATLGSAIARIVLNDPGRPERNKKHNDESPTLPSQ